MKSGRPLTLLEEVCHIQTWQKRAEKKDREPSTEKTNRGSSGGPRGSFKVCKKTVQETPTKKHDFNVTNAQFLSYVFSTY